MRLTSHYYFPMELDEGQLQLPVVGRFLPEEVALFTVQCSNGAPEVYRTINAPQSLVAELAVVVIAGEFAGAWQR